jgi:hypothetical protein
MSLEEQRASFEKLDIAHLLSEFQNQELGDRFEITLPQVEHEVTQSAEYEYQNSTNFDAWEYRRNLYVQIRGTINIYGKRMRETEKTTPRHSAQRIETSKSTNVYHTVGTRRAYPSTTHCSGSFSPLTKDKSKRGNDCDHYFDLE